MGIPKILVVDDEQNIRSALKRWFEARGFHVDLAEDGMVAVEKCLNQHYDLVTLDIEMPRMNGKATLAEIRKTSPGTPVIVLTGHFDETSDPTLDGAARVLVKPISLHVLEQEVWQALSHCR